MCTVSVTEAAGFNVRAANDCQVLPVAMMCTLAPLGISTVRVPSECSNEFLQLQCSLAVCRRSTEAPRG